LRYAVSVALTTSSAAPCAWIHDRMPAIRRSEDYDCRLGSDPDPRELLRLFLAELMTMWPVSPG
jgi:putative SOS response-associated peptidase YedK